MQTNLDKYKKDLDRLLEEGTKLIWGFVYEIGDEKIREEAVTEERLDFIKNYEPWYTEALEVVRQVIPERTDDFKKLYKDESRKEITRITYTVADAVIDLKLKDTPGTGIAYKYVAFRKFQQQCNILKSVEKRFESSLFDIKQLVQADLFGSELDAARELNKKGFTRGAGAIAGVVLEGHLSQICENHKIKVTKKNPTINDFNEPLKGEDVINTPTWRFIQHLADLRNLCDHNREREPKKEEIEELINGVEKITKTVF